MEREEIILVGEYRDFRSDAHFYMDGASAEDVAAILVWLSDAIEPPSYRLAGIDTEKIDAIARTDPGIVRVCEFLKSVKRDTLLPAAQNKTTMLPIAESYLLNRVLTQANVAFKPRAVASIKPEAEAPEDQIVFVGHWQDWFTVKKLSVDEKTQPWEVAGILAGINHTLVNKGFDFLGAQGTVREGRKSWGNLADALSQIDATNPYSVCKTCEGFGYKPYATPEILVNEYPDIKPPKVRGRKSKG